jgi:GAF domain-containing protein
VNADDEFVPEQLATEAGRQRLLQAVAEVTRAVFAAKACSLMSHDTATRELVFEAVAGEGSQQLPGRRIPATTGLAGWALASEEPIAVGDVRSDPRWARDVADDTGFVPTRMTVYPLLHDERSLGVLSVLDQASELVGLADMDILARLADHAAGILALVQAARGADVSGGHAGPLTGLERALASASPEQREAALAALAGVTRLLETD